MNGAQLLSSKRLEKYDRGIEVKFLFSSIKDPWAHIWKIGALAHHEGLIATLLSRDVQL